MTTYTLTTNDAARWRQVVPASVSVPRSVEYVRIGEQQTGWAARLFVVETDRPVAAYPYFLRPVETRPVFDTCTPEYTGPLALHGGAPGFSELFAEHCREQKIIAEFAHLNPWLDDGLLEPECIRADRDIVYVDLTQTEEQIWVNSLTSDARRMLKQGWKAGVQVRRAVSEDDVREFYRLYTQTMERRQALDRYFYPLEYFLAFHRTMAANAFFVLAEHAGRAVAGGLFLHDADVVYWHLSAADMDWSHVRPVNVYVHETIRQSLGQNWKRMILGGGYEFGDGVFRFKASFSPLRAKFNTYQRVHDVATYDALVRAWHSQHAGAVTRPGFFPRYRSQPMPETPTESKPVKEVVVVGGGGHAKVVISTLRACGYTVPMVFDDDAAQWGTQILGVPVSGPVDTVNNAGYEWGLVAIGENATRQQIARRLNLRWLTLVHPAAHVASETKLGAGTVVFAGAIIQPGSVLGEHVIVNTGATVDHDCRVEDFAHVGPGVHLARHVQVAEGAFVGTAAAVNPTRKIGAWTTVGAGAVVVHDLPEQVVAYGVPAVPKRPLDHSLAHGPRCAVLRPADKREWQDVLAHCAQHDFYHLPEYHQIEEERGAGGARLFVYREGGHVIAVPLLLRPVDPTAPDGWCDATSVYGYAGPVASAAAFPDSVLHNFRLALRQTLAEHRVITVFSRLHPLLEQEQLLAGLGDREPHGQTISIDLTLPVDQQPAGYRASHRNRINKLQRRQVSCVRDADKRHLPEFVEMYHETMRRVRAHESYFFTADYFQALANGLDANLQLFVVFADGRIVAGGLFMLCNGIVQYHLGGTCDAFLSLSPMGLVFDTVRRWACEQGARVLHLGGGVGAKEDSLFHFKAGFSERRHAFNTWRWVLAPDVYRELCAAWRQFNQRHGLEPDSADYFPIYRCPVVPVAKSGAIP